MSKIRLLQFPFSQWSGVTAYATQNWKYLNRERFECDFVVVRNTFDPDWEFRLLQSGAGIKTFFYSADREPERYADKLYKMLYGQYDVVHLHTSSWKRLLIEQISVACGIPKIIVHSHNTGIDLEDAADRRAAEERHYNIRMQFGPELATDFCACSRAAADWLFGEQIPCNQIKILHNAIEAERFIYNCAIREKYRQEFGLDRAFVVGHVGRFSHQKNHQFLLDVFQQVCKRVSNPRLLLIGTGPLEQEIQKKARQLKIHDKVIFAGQRGDVPNMLQAMDVFCLPSKFEGLPLVLVEAQASGLQCIASDLIDHEICITENISMLNLNAERWAEMIVGLSQGYVRKNMYDTITDAGYNIKIQIQKVEQLYSQ